MTYDLLVFTAINILLAWSVYIVLMSGCLSFANGGFMAFGAFSSGVATSKFGLPLLVSMLGVSVLAAALGALISLPALRTRGVYLILVTVGVSICMQSAIESTPLFGGVKGMGGLVGTELWHIVTLVVIVGLALWYVSTTPLQRILDAVREDELAAAAIGVNVPFVKVSCFAIGMGLAAAAGTLFAHYMIFIVPEQFNVLASVFIVLYVILGGINNFWGPAVGAAIMTVIPELIRDLAAWRPTIFGLLIVLLLLVRPEGIFAHRSITVRSSKSKEGLSGDGPVRLPAGGPQQGEGAV